LFWNGLTMPLSVSTGGSPRDFVPGTAPLLRPASINTSALSGMTSGIYFYRPEAITLFIRTAEREPTRSHVEHFI